VGKNQPTAPPRLSQAELSGCVSKHRATDHRQARHEIDGVAAPGRSFDRVVSLDFGPVGPADDYDCRPDIVATSAA
jgi:hypothetical protein